MAPALQNRLLMLWERTHDDVLLRMAHGESPFANSPMVTEQEYNDALSTCLMNTFKVTTDAEVFALLFEINRSDFLRAIQCSMRRNSCIDADDVLQEVFLNIYRYPHQFVADRPRAFRNWGHTIVRNTLLKAIKQQSRQPRPLLIDDDSPEPVDPKARAPERVLVDHESALVVDHAFVLFLAIYLIHYQRLSPKMQQALTRVEIEGRSYRDTAEELGMAAANFKVAVFRARRRILRGMGQSLAAMPSGAAP